MGRGEEGEERSGGWGGKRGEREREREGGREREREEKEDKREKERRRKRRERREEEEACMGVRWGGGGGGPSPRGRKLKSPFHREPSRRAGGGSRSFRPSECNLSLSAVRAAATVCKGSRGAWGGARGAGEK